jgi:hypothetical protein
MIILTIASKYTQLEYSSHMWMTFCLDSGDSDCCFEVNHDWNVHSISIVPNSLEGYVHANTYKAVLFLMYKLVTQGDYHISWTIRCSNIVKGSFR